MRHSGNGRCRRKTFAMGGQVTMALFWFCMAVMFIVLAVGGFVSAIIWFADTAERECAKRRKTYHGGTSR